MNFDPLGEGETRPQTSVADLELRSVICVPLVRIRTGQGEATSVLSTGSETVGVLYMVSRLRAADLAGGNRELLQTLAIEASTVLENARLLEEERAKQRMEEELRVARGIQQNLLPRELPATGWFRASGSSAATPKAATREHWPFATRNHISSSLFEGRHPMSSSTCAAQPRTPAFT